MNGGNPFVNALMMIVGALAVGAAIVLGFFAFVVVAGVVVILAGIIGIRLWWFRRKLQAIASHNLRPGQQAESGRVIEGEYTVVSGSRQKPPEEAE